MVLWYTVNLINISNYNIFYPIFLFFGFLSLDFSWNIRTFRAFCIYDLLFHNITLLQHLNKNKKQHYFTNNMKRNKIFYNTYRIIPIKKIIMLCNTFLKFFF